MSLPGHPAGAEPVDIAGVGIHPFGRFEDRTITDLGVHAVRQALDDAALGRSDLQATFCGTAYGGVASGHKVLGRLAMTGMPIVDVEAGCASGAAALMLGAASVRSGQYDSVLVLGIEKMPKGIIRSSFFDGWQETAGLSATPAYFALRAQRLMADSGITDHDLAAVVVKNRRNGTANPDAMFRSEVTAEAVLSSRMVCPPLRLLMLCSPNEGAAAVVLRRRDSTTGVISLRAATLVSHLPGSVLSESTPMSGLCDDSIPAPTARAARFAYEEAGVGPEDLDVVECQDTDAARELMSCEELGLCAAGEGAGLVRDGITEMGGRIPVNPSGGLLSKGEPLGASALGQVVELVRQLRGDAGDRQVDGARVGLAHTIGRGANASVVIVGR
ncbi:MAG: thiolase family protein [Acidimicrobiales bacterium]